MTQYNREQSEVGEFGESNEGGTPEESPPEDNPPPEPETEPEETPQQPVK